MFNASPIVAQSVSRVCIYKIFKQVSTPLDDIAQGTPIIYVNFNYRLGAIGFPQGNEAAQKGALNLGSKDALLALQWIQDNIEHFGGDKRKVRHTSPLHFDVDEHHALLGDGLRRERRLHINISAPTESQI